MSEPWPLKAATVGPGPVPRVAWAGTTTFLAPRPRTENTSGRAASSSAAEETPSEASGIPWPSTPSRASGSPCPCSYSASSWWSNRPVLALRQLLHTLLAHVHNIHSLQDAL